MYKKSEFEHLLQPQLLPGERILGITSLRYSREMWLLIALGVLLAAPHILEDMVKHSFFAIIFASLIVLAFVTILISTLVVTNNRIFNIRPQYYLAGNLIVQIHATRSDELMDSTAQIIEPILQDMEFIEWIGSCKLNPWLQQRNRIYLTGISVIITIIFLQYARDWSFTEIAMMLILFISSYCLFWLALKRSKSYSTQYVITNKRVFSFGVPSDGTLNKIPGIHFSTPIKEPV